MNTIYSLPKAIEIDGVEHKINSDFRAVLRIFEMFEDNELTPLEKQYCLIRLLYVDIPKNTAKAVEEACNFINGEATTESGHRKDYGRLYSWRQDRIYIFSAVDRVLGFSSRAAEYLHWWDWLSAFMEIGDCTFSHIVNMRQKQKQGKLTKDEKRIWDENPSLYCLRSENEISEEEILNYINGN